MNIENISINLNKFNIFDLMIDIIKIENPIEISLIENIIIENLDDMEKLLINQKSNKGEWLIYTQLNQYDKRFYLSFFNSFNINSLYLFKYNDQSTAFKTLFLIKENNLIKIERLNLDNPITSYELNYENLIKNNLLSNELIRDFKINKLLK